jgi:hypothetical protein
MSSIGIPSGVIEYMVASGYLEASLSASIAIAILSVAIGFAFSISVTAKIITFRSLVGEIKQWRPVSSRTAKVVIAGILLVEAIIALGHLSGIGLESIAMLTMMALILSVVVLSVVIVRNYKVPCICYGAGQKEQVNIRSIIRVLILLVGEGALYAFLIESASFRPYFGADGYEIAAVWVSGAAVVSMLGLLFAAEKLKQIASTLD